MSDVWQGGGWTLYHGDCLDVLRGLDAGSVDAVVTDPPYMIGAISVGTGRAKAGTWADMENSAHWYSLWMQMCKRILKPTGYLLSFCNWRSVPAMIRALSLAEMPATSCMVWDKLWIGPAGPQQLRCRYELVMFSAMPEGKIANRSAPDVESEKWLAGQCKETKHPAEKPVPLLQRLCRLVTPLGGVVLDPFAGSGSTGKGALLEGFRFIGIERERDYCEIAAARLRKAEADAGLFKEA